MIFKNKPYKFHKILPETESEEYEKLDNDNNVAAILGAARSYDNYQLDLYPLAKDKTVKEVILNYTKYFQPLYNKSKRRPFGNDYYESYKLMTPVNKNRE